MTGVPPPAWCSPNAIPRRSNSSSSANRLRWPRLARIWRLPVVGELVMGATTRRVLERTLRAGCVRPDAWTASRIDAIWAQFDQGTQRAILRLHRSLDERRLAAAGNALPALAAP